MSQIVEIDPDRDGFLTESFRDYLNGEKDDIDPSYENSIQGKIRDRIYTAFLEFQLLESGKLNSSDRELIYNRGRPDSEHSSVQRSRYARMDSDEFLKTGPQVLTFGFFSLFKFYYKTMREAGHPREHECSRIERAIKEAEQEFLEEQEGHYEVDVTVNIESVDSVDIESAKKRYKQDGIHGVTGIEMKALAEAGYLSEQAPDE